MTFRPVIRRISPPDCAAVLPLIDAFNEDQGNSPAGKRASVLAEFIDSGRLFGFVAEHEGRMVAYTTGHDAVTMEVLEAGTYLADLYVTPAWRRRGIARRLVDAMAGETKRRGGMHLWWTAMPDNAPAHATYRDLGATFEPVSAHALFGEPFDLACRRSGISGSSSDIELEPQTPKE